MLRKELSRILEKARDMEAGVLHITLLHDKDGTPGLVLTILEIGDLHIWTEKDLYLQVYEDVYRMNVKRISRGEDPVEPSDLTLQAKVIIGSLRLDYTRSWSDMMWSDIT